MFFIGCHLSLSKGFLRMGQDALGINANTFQFFSRNPRGTRARPLDTGDMGKLAALLLENGFAPLTVHAPYILNACSADEGLRALAGEIVRDDLERLEHLPGNYYNFHPGAHLGQGVSTGIRQIGAMLNKALWKEQQTIVLLETMSGSGTEVGGRFEDLRDIINEVELQEKVGVCLDTCHVYAAGYDILNGLDGVLEEFDEVVGLDRLKSIHLNDSVFPLGARKDRHANIGEGELGLEGVGRIINHPGLRGLPFNLETRHELPGYKKEIELLRELRKNP